MSIEDFKPVEPMPRSHENRNNEDDHRVDNGLCARPDDCAHRIELARSAEGLVSAPTLAEVVIAFMRGVVAGPLVAAASLPLLGIVVGVTVSSWFLACFTATCSVSVALVDMLLKTRARHVEHVRVRIFSRSEPDGYLLFLVILLYVVAGTVTYFLYLA